jgi:hypothetical protein
MRTVLLKQPATRSIALIEKLIVVGGLGLFKISTDNYIAFQPCLVDVVTYEGT